MSLRTFYKQTVQEKKKQGYNQPNTKNSFNDIKYDWSLLK